MPGGGQDPATDVLDNNSLGARQFFDGVLDTGRNAGGPADIMHGYLPPPGADVVDPVGLPWKKIALVGGLLVAGGIAGLTTWLVTRDN
jgi:hypothetical protein